MENKWFVLYTAPRAEKKVRERLEREGIEVFLPTFISVRKWSDRVKKVELPLMPSYIFVNCTQIKLRTLVIVPSVVRVVYYLGVPAIIKDNEITAIKDFIKLTVGNTLINEGDMVNILGGPFEKVSGKVIKLNKKFAYLYIESLQATVCVQSDLLEKN